MWFIWLKKYLNAAKSANYGGSMVKTASIIGSLRKTALCTVRDNNLILKYSWYNINKLIKN